MKKKITLAKQTEVKKLPVAIDHILTILGCPEALVTDESYVTDFMNIFSSKEQKVKNLKKLGKKLGVEVGINDTLIDVAKRWSKNESR